MKTNACFVALLLSLTMAHPRAWAQTPGDVAKAKVLQVEGLKHLDSGNAAAALAKFDAAFALVPSAKVVFNQGRAHEALGYNTQALAAFETFLAAAEMPATARQDAQHRIEKLRSKLSFFAVTGPSGAEVLLDGQVRGKLPFDTNIAMEPGLHEVRLQRDNQELHRQTLQARAGATINVNVVVESRTVVREPSPPVAHAASVAVSNPQQIRAEVAPPLEQDGQWMRPAAWITAGVATLALAVGGIAQWRSYSKVKDFDSYTEAPFTGDGQCGRSAPESGGGECPSLLQDSESAGDVAVGAFVTAGVMAAGAGALFFFSSRQTAPQGTAVALRCLPTFLHPGATCSALF